MVDFELSKQLKKQYRHRIGQCYKNAYRLFLDHKLTDKFIIGYIRSAESNLFIRHAWGVKDNKIIDSTLREHELKETEYFPVFEFETISEFMNAALTTSGPAMLELDPEKENKFLEKHNQPLHIRLLSRQ